MIDGKNLQDYQERLITILSLIGLTDRQHHKPEQLSGGEQQRVALARALIMEPAIVLADEPTGNLDSKTGMAIMELLKRSCAELGQTIVIVTHDPRAASTANRVVFLRDGAIIDELRFEESTERADRLRSIIDEMEKLEA